MSKKVQNWSLDEVSAWLKRVGLGRYSEKFRQNEIDGRILATMTNDDVRDPPVEMAKLVDRLKFGVELKKVLESLSNQSVETQCFAETGKG